VDTQATAIDTVDFAPDERIGMVTSSESGATSFFECSACRPFETLLEEAAANVEREIASGDLAAYGFDD
jgi:hypothetical protein